MRYKNLIRIILIIIAMVILAEIVHNFIFDPWLKKKTESFLSGKGITADIGQFKTSIFSSSVEMKNIRLSDINTQVFSLNGEISSIRLKGIDLLKARNKIFNLSEINISGSYLRVVTLRSFQDSSKKVIPADVNIKKIILNETHINATFDSSSRSLSITNGNITLDDLSVYKNDTLSGNAFTINSLEIDNLISVTPDSIYTNTVYGINYSMNTNSLKTDSFVIVPNFTEQEFQKREWYQRNYINASLYGISLYDFSLTAMMFSGDLVSSLAEIAKMNISVFRDKRKEFKKVKESEFQELLYDYNGLISIDSLKLAEGNVSFSVHEMDALKPGRINFTSIKADLYTISNDTIYKTNEAFLRLAVSGILMSKGLIRIKMKARLFDTKNSFSIDGSMSEMDIRELNPILENNASISVTSGVAEKTEFSFTADSEKSTGEMEFLYHDLNFDLNNEGGEKMKLKSFFVNTRVFDSNPRPGENVRKGIISFERDPERFVFHYWHQSVMSGIRSSIVK